MCAELVTTGPRPIWNRNQRIIILRNYLFVIDSADGMDQKEIASLDLLSKVWSVVPQVNNPPDTSGPFGLFLSDGTLYISSSSSTLVSLKSTDFGRGVIKKGCSLMFVWKREKRDRCFCCCSCSCSCCSCLFSWKKMSKLNHLLMLHRADRINPAKCSAKSVEGNYLALAAAGERAVIDVTARTSLGILVKSGADLSMELVNTGTGARIRGT